MIYCRSKDFPVNSMQSYDGSSAPFVLNLTIRRRRMVSYKPLTVNPKERAPGKQWQGKCANPIANPDILEKRNIFCTLVSVPQPTS